MKEIKKFLLVFELEKPIDMCQVIQKDFMIKPSPKLIFRENQGIFFFSACHILGRDLSRLHFGFLLHTANENGKFLVCFEEKGEVSVRPDERALASIRIFKVKRLFQDYLKELEFKDEFLLRWGYLVEANRHILEIAVRGREIILVSPNSEYLLLIGRNSFKILRMKKSIELLPEAAIFHNIRLFEIC